MKKGIALLCSFALICTLTACGSLPALSETEEQMISEYAASLLLKYDAENHSRLVDTSSFVTAYETAEKIYEDSKNAYYDSIEKEENKRKQEAMEQENLNATAQENAATNKSPYNADGDTNHSGGATVVDARDISALFNLSDFSITYSGYKILDSFPESGEDVYFSLVPTKENSLLVVYFNCTNNATTTQTLNVFDSKATFKLSLDNEKYSSVMPTYLDDDLSLYKGDFISGQTNTLVLITEVKKGTSISSLGVRVSSNGDSITKKLE